ncbi:MAG: type II secretion system protein GspG [Phycisphaerales bacterium]
MKKTQTTHLRRNLRRAFSLIELIVAVTIMAILAALVVPRVTHWIGFSKVRVAKSDTETIAQQVRMYMTREGWDTLPSDFQLSQLTEGSDALLNQSQLNDPWGNPYQIRVPGEVNADFDVYSFGADGQGGGEADNADIVAGARK